MDIELYCVETGAGMPFILLHGNGENSGYFSHQMEHFSNRYRVIALDTRGHGRSPRGVRPFTLEQFAEDLKEWLDSREIRRIFLLGFSDGGNIALLFAMRYPEYVEKLILNGANLTPWGVKAGVQIPTALRYGRACLLSRFSRKQMRKKELLGLMVRQPHISRASLMALTMPVLVIAGTDDMIRQEHTAEIARSIRGAGLRIIAGDHFIALKNSGEFNTVVEDFLERNTNG